MDSPSLRQIAVALVAAQLQPERNDGPEASYLADVLKEVFPNPEAAGHVVERAVAAPHPADAILLRLGSALGLSMPEVLALALGAAVEEDLMTGRVLAYAQAPLAGSRPTLGLMAAAFAPVADRSDWSPAALAGGAAVRGGLLLLGNDTAPYPERTVALTMPICLALAGRDSAWPGGQVGNGSHDVPLPTSTRDRCVRLANAMADDDGRMVLVLRSSSADEARSAASAVVRQLGRRPFFADVHTPVAGLAAWLHLLGLVPVFLMEAGVGEMRSLPSIPLHVGPIVVVAGLEGGVDAPGRDVVPWTLPIPGQTERRDLWMQALGDEPIAEALSRSHRLGAARIAQLGRLARHHARLAGLERPDLALMERIFRSGEGSGLEGIAQFLPDTVTSEALVLSPEVEADLEHLLVRCREREHLPDGLGISTSTRYAPGVRALFTGPTGTGKTLAAAWLASRLGLPLYRVDLASVTSKYIGETEKNLERLLSRAERTEAVLLFDEADSLFGNRTDVRDANDRFANAQTNYLLQRMETFDGIAVLTSNSRARFDTAFARRLDAIIEFPPPAAAQRLSLWQSHLGCAHGLAHGEVSLLANQCDLAGGQIRNVVLAAAVTARTRQAPLALPHVLHALEAEYRKAGRSLPPGLQAARVALPTP